jgi:hypothetical protein
VLVHLSNSLSNPGTPLLRLVTALDEVGGPEKPHVSASTCDAVMAQSGVVDPALVRLRVKENRILTPDEVAELVEAYRRGAGVRELARQYEVHRHTVDRHLDRAGIVKRPMVKMTPAVIARAREFQAQGWGAQMIGRELGVSGSAVWKGLRGLRTLVQVVDTESL